MIDLSKGFIELHIEYEITHTHTNSFKLSSNLQNFIHRDSRFEQGPRLPRIIENQLLREDTHMRKSIAALILIRTIALFIKHQCFSKKEKNTMK